MKRRLGRIGTCCPALIALAILCWMCPTSDAQTRKPADSQEQQDLTDELISASTDGKLEKVKDMVTRGADVNGECSHHGYVTIRSHVRVGWDIGRGNTPLTVAVSGGHIEVVKYLLSKGVNVEQKDRYEGEPYRTPLQWAAWIDRDDIANLLIQRGAQIDVYSAAALGRTDDMARLLAKTPELARQKNRYGASPLAWAVSPVEGPPDTASLRWFGRLACVELLTKNGADVEGADEGGNTVLQRACASNAKYRIVELLVAKGANVNATNDLGETPLTIAVEYAELPVVEHLIANRAAVNVRNESGFPLTPLSIAARVHDRAKVLLLLSKGATVNDKDALGRTPLHWAVYFDAKGYKAATQEVQVIKEICEALIARGAEINSPDNNGDTPLHCAVTMRSNAILAFFLARGADINLKNRAGQTPLEFARAVGFASEMSKVYAAQGIKVAKELPSADDMINVIDSEDPKKWEQLKTMVEENPKEMLNEGQIHQRECPFRHAIREHHMPLSIAEAMTAKGLILDAPGGPLVEAIWAQRKDVFELLLKEVTKIDPATGDRLLTGACRMAGQKDIVELLLARGVDPDGAKDSKYPPLSFAIRCGIYHKNDVAELLIKHGADVNRKVSATGPDEKDGQTLLQLAKYLAKKHGTRELSEIVELLEQAGAKE